MKFPLYCIATNKEHISKGYKPFVNAGDNFNYFLVEMLSNNYYKEFTFDGPGNSNLGDRFIFTGSLATDSTNHSILCGAGIIEKAPRVIKDFKECYGVRGKYTLDAVKMCNPNYDTNNIVLGDPGLLLSFLVKNYNKQVCSKFKYGLILHMIDKQFINDYFTKDFLDDILIIDIETDDFYNLSLQICQCEIIISSTLHGIIFANSFNKPTIYINLNKEGKSLMPKDNIKFYDYYSIFNIDNSLIENKIDYVITKDNVDNLNIITLKHNDVINTQIRLYNNIINVFKKYNLQLSNIYSNNIILSTAPYEDTYSVRNICDLIKDNKPFQIGRIGGCECDVLNHMLALSVEFDKSKLQIIPSSETIKKLQNNTTLKDFVEEMKLNSGYYDLNSNYHISEDGIITLIKFVNCILSVISNSDIILIGGQNYTKHMQFFENKLNSFQYPIVGNYGPLLNLISNKILVNYTIIEDFFNIHHWFPCLNDKKILIISPFTNEIKRQLDKKENIFTNNTSYNNNFESMKYPNFKKVEYVTMPLTTNNFTTPHKNIIETDMTLCEEIKQKDFDICLLLAGAHTYFISNFIRRELNKSSIHLGGCGQLLFGIKGPRWETTYFLPFMNEHWIFPDAKIPSSYNDEATIKADSLSAYFKQK